MIGSILGVCRVVFETPFLVIALSLAGMIIIIFYLINDIVKRETKLSDQKMLELRAWSETNVYRSITENYEKQRRKTHEYKNHMNCIAGMLGAGKIEEAQNYVININYGLRKEMSRIDTNHVIVNAILNTKFQEADDKNIVMVLKINDLSELPMSDEDIVIILSNMLSNAIEACEQNKGKRIIRIKFMKENKFIVIAVQNTIETFPVEDSNRFLTSKTDSAEEHGIGIENIKRIVEGYGGGYVVKYDQSYFDFVVMIPCGELTLQA